MLALLYCRQELVEQIHAPDKASAITEASRCLGELTRSEHMDWTLVLVNGEEVQRIYGPKI